MGSAQSKTANNNSGITILASSSNETTVHSSSGERSSCPVRKEYRSLSLVKFCPVKSVTDIKAHPDEEVPTKQSESTTNNTYQRSSSNNDKSGCPVEKGEGSPFLMKFCPVKSIRNVKAHPDEISVEEESKVKQQVTRLPLATVTATNTKGCPVKHDTKAQSNDTAGCPVKGSSSSGTVYNVYSQPIDPTNQMPPIAQQLPAPGQKAPLPTDRSSSTIPKGGTNDSSTWTYPSPQMFYNALVRKGKLDPNVKEEDVISVVAVHNNMNEKTWSKVMQWEKLAGFENSKLSRFMGKPSDLSPKARLKNVLLGHPLPFDRHDWTIVREDGSEVRYIIDYYHDETKASDAEGSGLPSQDDHNAIQSILVDVRPALDSPSSFIARVASMPYAYQMKETGFEYLPLVPDSSLKTQVAEADKVWETIQKSKSAQASMTDSKNSIPEAKEASELASKLQYILKECEKAQRDIVECDGEVECSQAAASMTLCMSKILCPVQYDSVIKTLNDDDSNEDVYNARVEKAFENAGTCIENVNGRLAQARELFPHLFEKK